jgi:hypothetical protein
VKVTEGGEKQSKESVSKRALGEINMEEEMIAIELKEQEVVEVPNKRTKKVGLADQPCKSQRRLWLGTAGGWAIARQFVGFWTSRSLRGQTCCSCQKLNWISAGWRTFDGGWV